MKKDYYNINKKVFYIGETPAEKSAREALIRSAKLEAIINDTEFVWKTEFDPPKQKSYIYDNTMYYKIEDLQLGYYNEIYTSIKIKK